jgi:hypothetical protein
LFIDEIFEGIVEFFGYQVAKLWLNLLKGRLGLGRVMKDGSEQG